MAPTLTLSTLSLLLPFLTSPLSVSAHLTSKPHSDLTYFTKRQTSLSDPGCTAQQPVPFMNTIKPNYPAPTPGKIAEMVPGDAEGQKIWNQRVMGNSSYANALKIAPKGTPGGNFAGVAYDGASDPDCWWSYTTCKSPKAAYLPDDYYACMEPRTWSLSFDDGPSCAHNPFYDFLNQNNLKASMFYIGINVMNNPVAAQRGVADGHQICVHTWSHQYMTTLTNEQVFAELYYTKKIIKDVTGITPRCWRPPFGDVDDRVRTIAFALDLSTNLWDHDTFDWEMDSGTPQSEVINNYNKIYQIANDTGGVGVLTHEISPTTMNLFMAQYPMAKTHFKHFMPMTSCYNYTTPYAESNITFPNFAAYAQGKVNSTRQTPFYSNTPLKFGLDGSGDSSSLGATTAAGPDGNNPAATEANDPAHPSSSSGSGSDSAAENVRVAGGVVAAVAVGVAGVAALW